MISSVICSSMRVALGAGEGEALCVERAAEGLLDLAPHLDLVGQVELGVEVLDDALLDAELGVAERLAQRHLGEHPAGRDAALAGRWRACRPPARAGSGPAAAQLAAAGAADGGGVLGGRRWDRRPAPMPVGRSRCGAAVTSVLIPPKSVGAPLEQAASCWRF